MPLRETDPTAAYFGRWGALDPVSNIELTLLRQAIAAPTTRRDRAIEIVAELEADGFRIVRA